MNNPLSLFNRQIVAGLFGQFNCKAPIISLR